MADREYVSVGAAIELDGVRYSHHVGIPARSWQVADETTREAFRERAREGLAQHLAETLPITITVTVTEARQADTAGEQQ